MARPIQPALVLEIIETDMESGQVIPFITSANIFVDSVLGGKEIPALTLEEIERWVAAHMIAITMERTAKKEEAGGAKIEYTGEWGKGLESTSYGQMAVALDYTGTLQEIAQGKTKAFIYAVKS